MPMRKRSSTLIRLAVVALLLVGSVALMSTTTPPYGPNDKAYYADEALVNFVRPGLIFTIISHELATDGTLKVRFKMTDPKGLPLDREGINTPGTVSSSFIQVGS